MLAPNTILQNRYCVVRQLGQGGMGTVYEALDNRVPCLVALKETLLEANQEGREAFEREAGLLGNLRHRSLPKVTDHFSENGGLFLVMEYIPGLDLLELMEELGGPFPVVQVLKWTNTLLEVLEYLHERKPPILHRDIKPSNLKLTEEGEIYLLDFGLAKGAIGEMKTLRSNRSARYMTPAYAPFEQIHGEGTDPRSDLYSLSATIYHLLTGLQPPSAPARSSALVEGDPDPLKPMIEKNSEVPATVAAIIHTGMAISRKERPASAREMRHALLEAEEEERRRVELHQRKEEDRRLREEEDRQRALVAEAVHAAQLRRRRIEQERLQKQEAETRREDEARQQQAEENRIREAEEAARQVEAERQRQEDEERQRREAKETQERRVAEEAARIRADEETARHAEAERQRREEEERLRRDAEEKETRRLAWETSRIQAAEQTAGTEGDRQLLETGTHKQRENAQGQQDPAHQMLAVDEAVQKLERGREAKASIANESADAEEFQHPMDLQSQPSNVPDTIRSPIFSEPGAASILPVEATSTQAVIKTLKSGTPQRLLTTPCAVTSPQVSPTDREQPPKPLRNRRPITITIVTIALIGVGLIVLLKQHRSTTQSQQAPLTQGSPLREGPKASASDATLPALALSLTSPQSPPAGMVYVPGGEFTMGRSSSDPLETPPHRVRVEPFFIDMYEVTCEDYKKFLDENLNQVAPPSWVNRNYPAGSTRKPATDVNWDDANAYAKWAGKHLPTEEEWEFAARGPEDHLYPWGPKWKPGRANTGKPQAGLFNGASGMVKVGSYQEGKSPYGTYDMIGNAWEWTASDWKNCVTKELTGLDSVDLKVIRGGSWASQNDQATATLRRCYKARGETWGYTYTGFRLAQDITHASTNR